MGFFRRLWEELRDFFAGSKSRPQPAALEEEEQETASESAVVAAPAAEQAQETLVEQAEPAVAEPEEIVETAPAEAAPTAPVEEPPAVAPAPPVVAEKVAAPEVVAKPEPEAETIAKPAPQPAAPTGRAKASATPEQAAQRLARVLVSELKLYNDKKIVKGMADSNLYDLLQSDIEKSRQHYKQRLGDAAETMPDYFHEELVKTLCEGDASKLGPNYRQT